MDINCHKCGEPWDLDTFHDVASEREITFTKAVREFRAKGCEATGWCKCERSIPRESSVIIAEIGDLLGDDVDGFASMLEDFGPMIEGI